MKSVLIGLCLAFGLMNGILRKSWDVFFIGICGMLLISINGLIHGIIDEKTLDAIFRTPDPITVKWWRIVSLLKRYGAKAIKGKESRERFELNGAIVTFHRPRSEKEARPYQVKDARRFLEAQRR